MRLYNMLGQKLFKYREDDSIHMVRIVNVNKPFKVTEFTKDPSIITIFDYDTNERRKVNVSDLSDYSPLEPDGILCVSAVSVKDNNGVSTKDVIVTATKYLNIKLKISDIPFAVCRQSITDIFYNLLAADESDMMVGLSVNQNTCPSNFDYRIMLSCSSVDYSDFINFYRTDTLEDLYPLINMNKFDKILSDLYSRHVRASKKPELAFKEEDKGWCKNLKLLLKQNDFQTDINKMLDIIQVDFKVSDFLIEKPIVNNNKEFTTLVANDELKSWLSLICKENITEANFIEYDHDINLAEFNNTTYLIIRDKTNKLYLVVYTISGQFFEADLIEKSKEMDFSTKFKIDFYNKYNRVNNK